MSVHFDEGFGSGAENALVKSAEIDHRGVTFVAKPEFFDLDLNAKPRISRAAFVEGLTPVEGGLMAGYAS